MSQARNASQTRELIFQACSTILIQDGLTELTLQAVADEAGLSKGGLLYHFPSKQELVDALFEYHNSIFEERLQELYMKEKDAPGAWLRAYAKASIEQITDPDNASLYASLFAAEERYASAHRLMRDKYVDWQSNIEDCGLDPEWAMLVRFVVDGWWFAEMHHYAPPAPEQHEALIERILNLTYKPLT